MSNVTRFCVCVLVVSCHVETSTAVADVRETSPPHPQSYGFNLLLVATSKPSRTELKLRPAQVGNLEMARSEFANAIARLSVAHTNTKKTQESIKELRKSCDSKAIALLDEKQQKRLNEIVLQLRGFEAFHFPVTQEKLQLTQTQAQLLKKLTNDVRMQSSEIKKLSGSERRRRIQELLMVAKAKMVNQLTVEQKKALEILEGKRISFTAADLNLTVSLRAR